MQIHKEDAGTYFATLVCYQRQPLLKRPSLKKLLIDHMMRTKSQFGLHVAAYAILDDHVHMVLIVPVGGELLAPMNHLRAGMARTWREQDQILDDALFWNPGLKSRLLVDVDELRSYLDFIHYDPVRHGVCGRAFDYPWSSLPARVEQGHYPEDWALLGPPASLRRVGARH